MKNVICKQQRALKAKILTSLVLGVAVLMLLNTDLLLMTRLLFFIIALVVFGFSTSYKITESFDNEKLFSVFDVTVFTAKLEIEFPDYVSVYSGSFSSNNDWSTISALGTKERHNKFAVRFFKENKNHTLYLTHQHKDALQKATALSELLNVELYDSTTE